MTELNSMVVVKDNAIEIERQEELKDFLQEQEQQVLEQFKPGTFGCHELLDRTAMVSDSLERFIVSPWSVLLFPIQLVYKTLNGTL